MITFANAAILAEALQGAEAAHKQSGEQASGWARWYAHYLEGWHIANVAIAAREQRTAEIFTPGDTEPTRLNISSTEGKRDEV